MPNVGRPSRDCHLCRQRRVKCDLLRPECMRCTRFGKKCPGYRDESLVFRVESQATFAQSGTQDRRRRRPEADTPDTRSRTTSPGSETGASVGKDSSTTPSSSIAEKEGERTHLAISTTRSIYGDSFISPPSNGLADDWDPHLLPFFMNKVCSQVDGQASIALMNFLPSMITKEATCTENSGLIQSCRAISYAIIFNEFGTPELRSRRSLAYGQALKTTNAALNDNQLRVRDETLVSIWLLSVYELITGQEANGERKGPMLWNTHLRGLITLLKLRGTAHLRESAGRSVFWLLYNSIQIRSFIVGVECPSESLEWFFDLSKDLRPGERYVYHVSRFGYDASVLCAKIREVAENDLVKASASLAELLDSAEHLEIVTADLLIPRITNLEVPQSGTSKTKVKDLGTITFRTFYCAYRMKLHLAICLLLTKVQIRDPSSDVVQRRYQIHVTTIQSLADEILAVKPVLFPPDLPSRPSFKRSRMEPVQTRYWTDGLRVLWPFRLVAGTALTRHDQKVVALEALELLHNSLGFPRIRKPLPP